MTDSGPFGVDWLSSHVVLFTVLVSLLVGLASAAASRAAIPRPVSWVREPLFPAIARSTSIGILLGLGIAAFGALSIAWEGFTFWDNHIFFSGLRGGGQYFAPMILPEHGRFFPLALQEFAWLGVIDHSGVLYHLAAVVQLLIVCACSIMLTRPTVPVAALLVSGIVTARPILVTYMGLTFPERNTIFLLSIFLVSLIHYFQTGRPLAIFVSMLAITPTLLYKETAFIFPGVIGATLIGAYLLPRLFAETSISRRSLLVAGVPLVVVAVAFVAYYVAVILPEIEVSYAATHAASSDMFQTIAREPWSWILAGALIARIWLLGWRGAKLDPVWDGLLVATILYGAAFFVLGLLRPNLISPVAFGAWLYAIHLVTGEMTARWTRWARLGVLALLAACAVVQLGPAWKTFKARKELVHSKASAARFVADYAVLRGYGTNENPLFLHPLPAAAFAAGLFGGFVAAKYDVNVIVALDGEPGDPIESCIEGEATPVCDPHHPLQSGELVIALGPRAARGLAERPDLEHLFRSEDIGFWKNWQYVDVYVAR